MAKLTNEDRRARADAIGALHDSWHDYLQTLPPEERAEWARKFGQVNAAYRNPNTSDDDLMAATAELHGLDPVVLDGRGIG